MASYRKGRINEDLQRELSSLIRTLKDPRVQQSMVSVTKVEATGDLRYAKVYISVLDKDKSKETIKGLKSAGGFLRREIGSRLQLRYTPELIFEEDDSIAYGAKMKGAKATIIMPNTAPKMKVEAIKALGAEVISCDAAERFEVAAKVCEERGSTMVPPYDDYDVMAGQGTLGLEIMEQCPDVDLVVVPASGGGLIGGVSTAIKGVNEKVKVIGAEPSVLPRYSVSLEMGEPTMVPMPEQKSVADALVSNRPGLKCFPVVRDHVDGFAAVDDTYMLKAMKMLLMEGKLLAEPSSCIGMGAVLQGKISVKPEEKVCFVISGGNLGFEQLELLGGVEY